LGFTESQVMAYAPGCYTLEMDHNPYQCLDKKMAKVAERRKAKLEREKAAYDASLAAHSEYQKKVEPRKAFGKGKWLVQSSTNPMDDSEAVLGDCFFRTGEVKMSELCQALPDPFLNFVK